MASRAVDPASLHTLTGTRPVTDNSGKHHASLLRLACDDGFRQAAPPRA